MVERANPSYDYIGFVDGRRVRPVTCSGDTEYCTEIEGRTIDHVGFLYLLRTGSS